jgi:hypothetical protein
MDASDLISTGFIGGILFQGLVEIMLVFAEGARTLTSTVFASFEDSLFTVILTIYELYQMLV